jgi:hypothetical protein
MTEKLSRQLVTVQLIACAVIGTFFSLSRADDTLLSLGDAAERVQEASAILHLLSQRSDLSVADVLLSMKGQSESAKNWYLALAQMRADRQPLAALEDCRLLVERSQEDPVARFWAFLYLTRHQPETREQLLESMLEDSSPELRYEAIQRQLDRMDSLAGRDPELLRAEYEGLLHFARLPSQVQQIAAKIKNNGGEVNLLEHFGFLDRWQTIGPFDNTNQSGFDVAYGPEADYIEGRLPIDQEQLSQASYQGKASNVSWRVLTTKEQDGSVDLAAAYDKEKGAVVYAIATFSSPIDFDAQVRVGSQNALKVWVNGHLALAREVYHAGGQIDQYRADVRLRAGENSVLVKICQNEQTESWAQSWFFQLRFSDSTGAAIRFD